MRPVKSDFRRNWFILIKYHLNSKQNESRTVKVSYFRNKQYSLAVEGALLNVGDCSIVNQPSSIIYLIIVTT